MHDIINTMSFYEGKLYICTHGGLSIFNNGYFDNSLGERLQSENKRPNALYFEKTGSSPLKMWVIGNNYLGYIIDNKLTIVEKDLSRLTRYDYNSSRYFINKGNEEDLLLVGNHNNGYIYRKSTREFFPLLQENGFQGDGCSALFADREGNLWRTWKRGIDKLNNINIFSYNTSNGLLENEVSAIFEYAPGKLLLGHNNGITFFSKDSIRRIKFDNMDNTVRGNLRVMKFCKDKNGTIWFAASNHGVGKLDLSGHITWFHNLFNINICSISVDDDGLLWVTSDKGVFTVKNGDFHNPTNMGLIITFYREIFFIDKVPYFTSPLGIATLKDGKPFNIAINNNANANDIYCLFKTPSGEILTGGKDGLYILKNNSLKKYDKLVIDTYVYSIMMDKHSNYWFGTDNGVVKWDGNMKMKSYVKANGLSGLETNRSAILEDSFGNIWVGTESGLSCFRTDFTEREVPIPEVHLVDAEDPDGNKYPLSEESTIKRGTKSLLFNFRGLSFYNEEFLRYRIKLEGVDQEWMEISQQHIDKIRYTNLSAGKYIFHVSAKNISGEWSKVYSSAVITIDSPIYKKTWFIILSFLFIILILFLFYLWVMNRIYLKNLEKKVKERTASLEETEKELRNTQSMLEEKVKERTENLEKANEKLQEINDSKDRFFSIIAHDLRSPFVGLIGYSEVLKNDAHSLSKEDVVEYSENLYKIIKSTFYLLENLLNWSLIQTHRMPFKKQKVDLNSVVTTVFQTLEANSKTKKISLFNEVNPESYIYVDKDMINLMIRNLVSNAIKYSNPHGFVRVYSRPNANGVEIIVEDNGIGIREETIEKLFSMKYNISTMGTANEKGTGLGLMLVKEMVDLHNGEIFIKSEPGLGSSFHIIFPKEDL